MTTPNYLIDAYKAGQSLQDKTIQEIVYDELVTDVYMFDNSWQLFFTAGHKGHDLPQWVTGWRYGNVPQCGVSYNYRDDKPEPGISMMEITTPDGNKIVTKDKLFAIFNGGGRPQVHAAGWLHFDRGSDGEPMLVDAVQI